MVPCGYAYYTSIVSSSYWNTKLIKLAYAKDWVAVLRTNSPVLKNSTAFHAGPKGIEPLLPEPKSGALPLCKRPI